MYSWIYDFHSKENLQLQQAITSFEKEQDITKTPFWVLKQTTNNLDAIFFIIRYKGKQISKSDVLYYATNIDGYQGKWLLIKLGLQGENSLTKWNRW